MHDVHLIVPIEHRILLMWLLKKGACGITDVLNHGTTTRKLTSSNVFHFDCMRISSRLTQVTNFNIVIRELAFPEEPNIEKDQSCLSVSSMTSYITFQKRTKEQGYLPQMLSMKLTICGLFKAWRRDMIETFRCTALSVAHRKERYCSIYYMSGTLLFKAFQQGPFCLYLLARVY